jgi:NADH:ubiquinone reductase (H+-translocating)
MADQKPKPPRNTATITPEQALALAGKNAIARPAGPTRIVVLGGGFAGVYTAKYLTQFLSRRKDVQVELLSSENYFIFQPLLPEVAAGGIAATHVVNPIRELVPKAQFRWCKIRNIDFQQKRVVVSQGEGLHLVSVPYDHLVFCLGKVTNFSSKPGVAEHALAMKDLSDAFRLRNHVLRCLELADIESDSKQKQALLSFVVAGGGFSGVETVGELEELVSRSLKYFKNIKHDEVQFRLIHSQATLLPEMPKKLGENAKSVLEKRGIKMVLNSRVKAASHDRVYLNTGHVIAARTFVCTVGNAPNPICKHAMKSGKFEEATSKGKALGIFATDAYLQCIDRPGYWAVGDCAGVPNPSGEGFCPPTAQFAIREAKTCAQNIVATMAGKAKKPFKFKALGILASLGNRKAVADLMGIRLTGFLAWFAWRGIYLSKLPGFGRKVRVAIDWALDLFFARDITQLQVFQNDRLQVYHYEPGEYIVRKGQVGREFYMIQHGEVDVIEDDGEGVTNKKATQRILARLGPRDVFGERALLEECARTASVRCVSAVDVLVMSRADFRSLVDQFPVLEEYFHNLLLQRYPKQITGQRLMDNVLDDHHPMFAQSDTVIDPRPPLSLVLIESSNQRFNIHY